MVGPRDVHYTSRELPFLFDGDAVVLGGSFAGISAALKLATAGLSVALVEPRTYLGREVTATLRPWLNVGSQDCLPEPVESFVERLRDAPASEVSFAEEIPFAMDAIKLHLEDCLL
ncbi:MAG: FAD-dependent oxidoreductase [Trueperaceae bacterium]